MSLLLNLGQSGPKKRKTENPFVVSENNEDVASEQKSSQNLCALQTHKIGEEPIK